MKTKQEIFDYLMSRKEYYENQVNWCKEFIINLDFSSPYYTTNYKAYKWLLSDYESRLDVVNDLIYHICEKE